MIKDYLKIFAEALKNLNIKFAWIVNSEDGLDEDITLCKNKCSSIKRW